MLNRQLNLPRSKGNTVSSPVVLVIDDNEDNILYASSSLELSDCQAIVASDGQTALNLAIDRLPDLILMDIVMPKIDGISLTKILKSDPRTCHIPVIAVTGLVFTHHKEQIVSAGFDDYLGKPYSIEDLEDKLNLFIKPLN